MTITASGTSRDKVSKAYVSSLTRPEFTALESVVTNSPDNPLTTENKPRGTSKFIFNEVNSVGLETIEIINFTIPITQNADLNQISCSGENIAKYIFMVNNNIREIKRTIYLDYNTIFELKNLELQGGDNIKLLVENRTSEPATFNATLKYNEIDL